MIRKLTPGLATAALLGLAALAPVGAAHAGPNGTAARSEIARPGAHLVSHRRDSFCRFCFNGWTRTYYLYCGPGYYCPRT